MNGEAFDRAGDFDTGTHTFTAPVAGLYHFCGCSHITGLVDQATSAIGLFKNGSQYAQGNEIQQSGTDTVAQTIADLVELDVDDEIDLRGFFAGNGGSGVSFLDKQAGIRFTYLCGWLVG